MTRSPPPPQYMPRLPPPVGEVHLWISEPEAVSNPRLLAAYEGLLDAQERERHQKFRFEKHRREFLVSRALVRLTLSRYAPVAPGDWHFVKNEFGRPDVHPGAHSWLRFNLSHTNGMVLCAVTVDANIGVDVEDWARRSTPVELSDRFFAPEEAAALRALPPPNQAKRFFEYWTLKEAYIKARGVGLSVPLKWFSFHLRSGSPPRITFDPRLADEPDAWQFFQLQPSARYQAGLAVRRPRELPLTVRCWRTVPLSWDESVPWEALCPP